jgi:hypothetical protein
MLPMSRAYGVSGDGLWEGGRHSVCTMLDGKQARRSGPRGHPTYSVCPVMYPDSEDARNTAGPTISSGSAVRCRGTMAPHTDR